MSERTALIIGNAVDSYNLLARLFLTGPLKWLAVNSQKFFLDHIAAHIIVGDDFEIPFCA
jgi:hypothetical protein